MSEQITLGCIAQDLSSGFEGTVTSKLELFNGNVQYALQPKMAEGATSLPESMAFDAALLVYKGPGVSDRASPAQQTDIEVGDEVVDIVSGHDGIVTTKTTFINGCVYCEVTTRKEGKKSESKTYFTSCTRLERRNTKVTPIAPEGEKPTGGPTTRAFRAN